MRRILSFFIFVIIAVTSQVFAGTDYYVDANNGNDLNDGFTPATAWQTIVKVNGSSFSPGDFILFKCGEVWREQLTIPSSGSASDPITFGAFGSGPIPVISGADSLTSWTHVSGTLYLKSGITPEPNQVFFDGTRGNKQTAIGDVDSENDWFWDSNVLYIYYTEDPDGAVVIEAQARTYCVFANNKDYITIENIEVKYSTHGIQFQNGSDNNIIDGITATYAYNNGIRFIEGGGNHSDSNTIQDCTVTYAGSTGILLTASSDCIVQRNTVHHNVQWATGVIGTEQGGIRFVDGDLSKTGDDNIIQNNTIYSNGKTGLGNTGFGIYLDYIGTGNIVRYNLIYDNAPRGGISLTSVDDAEIYYNIIYGETDTTDTYYGNGIMIENLVDGNKIYNNTIYNCHVGINMWGHVTAGAMVNNLVRNNIVEGCTIEFVASGGGENDGTYGSGNVYSHNCFGAEHSNFIEWGHNTFKSTYDAWETAYGATTNSVESDPSMTDPAYDDFTLQAGSPCLDAGMYVGLTEDYAGNTVPYGWGVDIGAYEYIPDSPLNVEINTSPTSGYVPLTVDFTGSASGGTNPYNYVWDFGDGESSSAQNPSHTYSQPGDYTAKLTVSDSAGNEDTGSIIISATEQPAPLTAICIGSPTSGEPPLTVNFTGSATGGTSPYSYSWDFGDGASSSKRNPSHTYTNAGTYNVTLTVTDFKSNQASDSLTITTSSIPTYQLAVSSATGSPAPGAGGTTDPQPGNHTYSVGNSVQVEAIPNSNYRFSIWNGDVSDSDAGNNQTSITMNTDKSLSALFCVKCGDVTGDLNITPSDAQTVFEIFLGKFTDPTECQKENADVNNDGTKSDPFISPADAQAIFNKYLGISELPSDCSINARSADVSIQIIHNLDPIEDPYQEINLIIDDVNGTTREIIAIPVIIDNPQGLDSFGFDLTFPSENLRFIGVEKTELVADFHQIDGYEVQEGMLRVGGYSSEPILSDSPGELVRLLFRVTNEAEQPTPLFFTNAFDDLKNAIFNTGIITINESDLNRTKRKKIIR